MAINIIKVQSDVRTAIKTAMSVAYGEPEPNYDAFAGVLADSIVPAILNEIKNNADDTGITAGSDTIGGGVN